MGPDTAASINAVHLHRRKRVITCLCLKGRHYCTSALTRQVSYQHDNMGFHSHCDPVTTRLRGWRGSGDGRMQLAEGRAVETMRRE
jgi:hypothetical protein